jgi:hypothetical protein
VDGEIHAYVVEQLKATDVLLMGRRKIRADGWLLADRTR